MTNNSSHCFHTLNQVSDFIGLYVITVVCAIGIITNFCFLMLLFSKSLKHKFYNSLRIKAVFDFLLCVVGIGYLNNNCNICTESKFNTYPALFYSWFIIQIPLRIAFLGSNISEIYMISNRCISLFNPKSKILAFNKWYVILVISVFTISLGVPGYFAIELKETNIDDMYTWNFSQFGQTNFFKVLFLSLLVIENILPIILLILLNLICVIKFRRVVSKSISIRNNFNSKGHKLERRFSKTTIILSILFTFLKLIECFSSLSNRVILNGNGLYILNLYVNNFFRQFTFLLNFIFAVSNSFFYIYMDSNLRKLFFKKLSC